MTEMILEAEAQNAHHAEHQFLLQRVQPALTGLIDGSLSTLAPIFAVALATQDPHYAFLAGLATSFGAGLSMAYSEGLSDTGELTGRGHPIVRGAITGFGTFVGGILHTLPFLIPHYRAALILTLENGIPHLDKFAVSDDAQGEGLGRAAWQVMRADNPRLFWRSRADNAINDFYFDESEGCVKGEKWNVFWYGLASFDEIRFSVDHCRARPATLKSA